MVCLNYMINKSQRGAVPVLILIAAVGVVVFLALSSSAEFKHKIFGLLYSKPSSYAVSNPISGPITPTPTPTPVPDTESPNISITYPLNAQTIRKGRSINILASASDNVAVAKVEFYVAGTLVCTDTAASYSCSWNVPKQPRVTYLLTVKALDTSGNLASSNISVTAK